MGKKGEREGRIHIRVVNNSRKLGMWGRRDFLEIEEKERMRNTVKKIKPRRRVEIVEETLNLLLLYQEIGNIPILR